MLHLFSFLLSSSIQLSSSKPSSVVLESQTDECQTLKRNMHYGFVLTLTFFVLITHLFYCPCKNTLGYFWTVTKLVQEEKDKEGSKQKGLVRIATKKHTLKFFSPKGFSISTKIEKHAKTSPSSCDTILFLRPLRLLISYCWFH